MGTLLLIRHGQASFGAADYDHLSDHGRHQAAVLGADLAARDVKPARLISGSMRRQRDTLTLAAEAAGWTLEPETDPRWNEFSHVAGPRRSSPDPRKPGESGTDYERRADSAIDRWFTGETESEEPFGAFMARVVSGLEETRPGSGETYAVFTSAGTIAAAAAYLLAGDLGADNSNIDTAIWPRLNRVAVNTGVTKVVVGRRGMSLVSFNDHGHLSHAEVSYR